MERSEVTLSTALGTIWPELSTEVARCTIADALGHRCGLIGVPNGSIEGLLDWDASIAAIATSEPLWTPGAAHGEHAFTYGHLIGELVRRITGQSIGSLIRSEISEGHDIDVHIGLGSEELGRVTDIATDPDFWSSIGWTSREALAALGADPGIGADVVNSAWWRTRSATTAPANTAPSPTPEDDPTESTPPAKPPATASRIQPDPKRRTSTGP